MTYRTSYVGIDTRLRYNNYVSYVAQQQADAAKNTNEFIWNGQLSKTFLRSKSLIVAKRPYRSHSDTVSLT